MKAKYGWSDKIFSSLLQLVHHMLLDENTLPKSYYQAKKILCLMDMEYQKIHACPNDCILYKHEFQEMPKCPRCGVSWYKVKDDDECSSDENSKKGPQAKVLWFRSFQGLSVCLLMETMKKTLHGMQMGEITMECSVIRLIPPNGRKLIVCIWISAKRQEILGLD